MFCVIARTSDRMSPVLSDRVMSSEVQVAAAVDMFHPLASQRTAKNVVRKSGTTRFSCDSTSSPVQVPDGFGETVRA